MPNLSKNRIIAPNAPVSRFFKKYKTVTKNDNVHLHYSILNEFHPKAAQVGDSSNTVILDVVEKKSYGIADMGAGGSELRQLLDVADECGVTVVLEVEPRTNKMPKRLQKKITKAYLTDYYKKFGFTKIADKDWMVRVPKKYAKGGKTDDEVNTGIDVINNMETDGLIEGVLKNGGLLAPNGKPSNLTPEQHRLVRTPEFKAWFGDWEDDPENSSKAISVRGEPLVVYHGSDRRFNVFKKEKQGVKVGRNIDGFYFTEDEEVAKLYTYSDKQDRLLGKRYVKPFFLNLRNPLVVDLSNKFGEPGYWSNELDRIIKNAKKKGHDGVILKNIVDTLQGATSGKELFEYHSSTYVVFSPEQIKLADGTNKTFNPMSNDIRYGDGGLVSSLNDVELSFLKRFMNDSTTSRGLLRKFMDKEDIKTANTLVKKGVMEKGLSDDPQASVIYYLDLKLKQLQELEDEIEKRFNPKYMAGGETENPCISYIKKNDTVLSNGYFLDLNEIYKNADKNKDLPQGLSCTLVTYNSGGQAGIKVIDTINPIELTRRLESLFGIKKEQAAILVHLYIKGGTRSKKAIRLHCVEDIKTDKIVIVDRDRIVCQNLTSNYSEGGETPTGENIAPNGEPSNLTPKQYKLVRTPEFKAWFGDWEKDPENASRAVDKNGEPLVVYHGTTRKFFEFDKSKGQVESHFGLGLYFTTSLIDAQQNYLSTGADLKNRIETLAEKIASDEDIDYEKAYKKAERELKGRSEVILPVFLKMMNPIDLRKNGTRYDSLMTEDENGNYVENEDSLPMKLYNALQSQSYGYTDIDAQRIYNDVSEAIGDWDWASAYDVDKAIRASEGFISISNDSGDLACNEYLREVYEEMGFDGIIMDADMEFGSRRKFGAKMTMDTDTEHFIVFSPEQIKLADGRNKTFDGSNPDIRYAKGGEVYYHGTDDEFDEFDINKTKKWRKFGLWFAAGKEYAKSFGENVKAVTLDYKKAKTITGEKWNEIRVAHAKDEEWFEGWKKKLIEQGYDAVKIKEYHETFAGRDMVVPEIVAVFRNEQVKVIPDTRYANGGATGVPTMDFWHGGNLDDYSDIIAQKSGRYEYGSGLYLTTKYDVAIKYAKGSRKLYKVTIEAGNEISKSFVEFEKLAAFVKGYVSAPKRKGILDRLSSHMKDGKVRASIFNTILLNEKAISPSKTYNLRSFYIDNGIDYEIVDNAYGWGEKMVVLYNMKKIVEAKVVDRSKITVYDLPVNAAFDSYAEGGRVFWGSAGAGILPVCVTTGRILLNHRSHRVLEPNTWGVYGGKLDDEDLTAEGVLEAAKREFFEETGYTGEFNAVSSYVFKEGNFSYHNFIGLFEEEFEPELNWESAGYRWVTFGELLDIEPKHFGLRALIENDAETIMQYAGVSDELGLYANGGKIPEDEKSKIYGRWKKLVNMSAAELRAFYESDEGKKAGLSASEAKDAGIDSGRESARWIMKMKGTPKADWTPAMWRWAKKQISFISRMSGNKGGLYDDSGNKTRKHTSLLIWGHNPNRYNAGGKINSDMKKPKTVEEIADKHGVPLSFVRKQLISGTEVELEHTNSTETARTIALHHLEESPGYYIRLKKMEMDMAAEGLKDYYKSGGTVGGAATCEVLDKNGERKTDPKSIEKLTKCIEGLPQTKTMHYDFDKNAYTPDRRTLHRKIIYDIKKHVVCVDKGQPIAILMGGSPASGKTTFLKKYSPYLLKEEILKVDADEIRSKLPEYRGFNASQTHLETKDIVNTLLSDRNIGIPCSFDLIYDGTMNNTKSYLPLINLLHGLGYKVFIVYIDKVEKDVVTKRSLERYKKSGRFVPLEVIDDFFAKGKSALEILKKEADGYMIVDGSNSDYAIIEKGGMELPQDRQYSKIGTPIQIEEKEIVAEFKKGGDIDFNPDDKSIKDSVTHKSGAAGGMLVGRRHSEGGIKAVNKSTGQPLEMEGGEVVITRNAVSDTEKREFEGEMLTNREILSRINESGGGVSFASGGKVSECACSGKVFKHGGVFMTDYQIIAEMRKNYPHEFEDQPAPEPKVKEKVRVTPSMAAENVKKVHELKKGGYASQYERGGMVTVLDLVVPSMPEFLRVGEPVKSPYVGETELYYPLYDKYSDRRMYFKGGHRRGAKISPLLAYKTYLYDNFGIELNELPAPVQNGLRVGKQEIIDRYHNS